jgi:Fe-S cluster assembly protein SufD
MSTIAETLLDRISVLPQGNPAWVAELRERAASSLKETGFPHKKVEAWRFTPIEALVRVPFGAAPAEPPPGWEGVVEQEATVEGDDSLRVLVVNGRPRLEGEAPEGITIEGEAPEGVEIAALADALAGGEGALRDYLGQAAPAAYFGALNTALFEDGLVVRVREGARIDRPLHVVHVTAPGADPAAAYPRLLVIAEPRAELQVIESYVGHSGGAKSLTCAVTEVFVGQGASVDHLRVVSAIDSDAHLAHLAVRQDASSSYASRSVVLGGGLTRLDLDATLRGEGASCALDGIYHATGSAHIDHHTFIDHAVPRCSSQEVYRGLIDDRGHGVFDGTIAVRKDAQQSSAHQENRNLLLSDDATVHTKPHLQIDADDVSCSHGATIGDLDEEALFYLRARGIGEAQAQAMLTYAFVKELVDRIPHEASRRRIGGALLERLPHGSDVAAAAQLEAIE